MIALITGAGRGIGRAIAIALAGKGIHTILVARSEHEIKSVTQEIISTGGKATALACDITDPKSVTSLYDETSKIGKITILINNAGIAPSAKIDDTDDEMWENAFATNVDGAFFLIRTYLPDMKTLGEAHIINIASTAAIEGFPYTAAYTASKHALIGLSRAIAKEIARYHIKVSTICPGFVRTNILEAGISNVMSKTGKSREQSEAQLAAMNKKGKILEPKEVAAAVLAELDMPLDESGREIIL
jgi:NAD(P)-dependent dehydrogenase (short-subunit alcohol dehydrogenase family)